MSPTQRPRLYGMLFALLAAFGFSFKAILVKLAYAWQPVDAITLLALRMLFALPFSWPLPGMRAAAANARVAADDWLRLTWLGLTGYYLASILDFWGLGYINAGLERLILFLYPTLVVLLGAWLGRRRVARREIWALALSYGGIAVALPAICTSPPTAAPCCWAAPWCSARRSPTRCTCWPAAPPSPASAPAAPPPTPC